MLPAYTSLSAMLYVVHDQRRQTEVRRQQMHHLCAHAVCFRVLLMADLRKAIALQVTALLQ